MDIRKVKCPKCSAAASCQSANYISVSRRDVGVFEDIKDVHLKVTEFHHVTKRPFYHAIHYPGIAPALNNIKKLPEKYSAGKWRSGFNLPYTLEKHHDSVVRCESCNYLSTHELDWPNDAFFQVEFKGQALWAYDRETALKLLNYIESTDRNKRITAATDANVVQDYFLRKIPEYFQTSKARPSISRKLRKILGLSTEKKA